jgi:hypothetical protein
MLKTNPKLNVNRTQVKHSQLAGEIWIQPVTLHV